MIHRISAASSVVAERDSIAAVRLMRERELDTRLEQRVDLHERIRTRLEEHRLETDDREKRITDRALDQDHFNREHPPGGPEADRQFVIPVNGYTPSESEPGSLIYDRFEKPEYWQERELEDRLKGTWLDAVV